MTIAACLVWYDEPAATLDRCVRSLAGLCDALVAVDGRWRGFPARHEFVNLDDGAAVIERAARDSDLRLPEWPSQAAKRSYTMQQAATLGDWVLVIDADEHVASFDRQALTEQLSGTTADVAEVTIRNVGAGLFQTKPRPRRRVYRAAAGITVEQAHNGYRTADGRWLNGDAAHVSLEPSLDLAQAVELVHDRDARSADRAARAAFYYQTRTKLGEETWAA